MARTSQAAGIMLSTLLFLAATSAAEPSNPELPPDDAQPEKVEEGPRRQGFTMELGLGVANTNVASEGASSQTNEFGLAPLSLGVGGFVHRDIAVLLRMAGTSYYDQKNGLLPQRVNGYCGLHVQLL